MPDLTENELLAALEDALQIEDPEDAHTTRELSDDMGLSVPAVRELLRPLVASGKVEPCRVTRVAIDGRRSQVSAYRWKDEAA